MSRINFDISDFDKTLYTQAITLMTCFDVFVYDELTHKISESPNVNVVRRKLADRKLLVSLWLSFSTGYELLFKSVLAKHKALNVSKGTVSKRKLPDCSSIDSIRRVYDDFILACHVEAKSNDYLKGELRKNKIDYLHDFSTGSLGQSLWNLKKLFGGKIITDDERCFLQNASHTLLDIRRNVDAHTFYGLTVGASINDDLSKIYLPATNLLLDIYYR